MADQNTIEKVYDIKMLGGSESYQTLANINRMFEQIKANKTSLNGVFNINVDTSKLGQLDSTMLKLIDEIKVMTAGMKDLGTIGSKMANDIAAAMAKLNMATIPNIMGFQKFQESIRPGNIEGYSQAIGDLGARLSYLKDRSTQLTETQKRAKEELDKNIITQQEYAGIMAQTTTELQMAKTQITEVSAAMTTMNKLFNPALTIEESEALAANRLQLELRNKMLKAEAVAQNAVNGSRDAARAKISELQAELGALNVTTDEHIAKILATDLATDADIAKQKELIATLDLLHGFVKENSDSYTKQKINIGNYPELKTEFSALKQQMVELILAGKADSAEFQELQAQALKLAASMKEVEAAMKKVNAATKDSVTTADKFTNIVEKMGLRMIANLIIFQTAIEIYTQLADAYKLAQDRINFADIARQEIAKNTANAFTQEAIAIEVMRTRFNDLGATMEDKREVVEELNEKIKGQYTAIADVNGAEKFFIDKSDAFIQALKLRAEAQANLTSLTKEYEKEVEILADPEGQLSWWDKLGATTRGVASNWKTILGMVAPVNSGKAFVDIGSDIDFEKRAQAAGKSNEALKDSYNKQTIYLKNIIDLQRKAAELDKKNGFTTDGTNDPKVKIKEAHDYTAALLEAQKKLNDFLSKTRVANIQDEMAAQTEIYSNVHRSLNDRLAAYAIYARDVKQMLDIQKQTEIKDVQDKLNKISEIENAIANKKAGRAYNKTFFDKEGKIRPEEQVLLYNKPGLEAQIDYIRTEYAGKLNDATREIGKGIVSISKTSVDDMLSEIDLGVKTQLTKINDSLTDAKRNIHESSMPKERQDRLTATLELKNSVDTDKINDAANQEKIADVQQQLDIAIKAKDVDREKIFQDKLIELKSQGAQIRAKLAQDETTEERDGMQDREAIQKEVVSQSFSAIQKIANDYIHSMEQIDAYREEMAQRHLSWNEKMLNAEAQSGQQKTANDKAAYAAEQALSKQKAEDTKRRAIIQATINEGLAATQIIVNTLMSPAAKAMPDSGLSLALVQEAASMAAFGAQISMISSQQSFGGGGEVPSSGGMFGGRSHSAGGTPFSFQGGRFEAEAGELAIINKRSAGSDQMMTVTGTPKQIASGINAWGGGHNFAPGASLHQYEWGGSLGANLQPPAFISEYYTRKAERGYASHDLVMEIAKAIQMHAASVNDRIDNLHVSLNPHQVTDFQNTDKKSVKVGAL